MKLVIPTQYRENYGAHDWDGEGECPQYWKSKGGSEYQILGIGNNYSTEKSSNLNELFNEVCNLICYSNEGSEEYALGWNIVEDSYIPTFEQQQMEYGDDVHFEPVLQKVNGVWKKITKWKGHKGDYIHTWTIDKGHELSEFEAVEIKH